jgi:hypothetical protein
MTSLVAFDRVKKIWDPSNSAFCSIFAIEYEHYLDRSIAPQFSAHVYRIVGPELAEFYPEKYRWQGEGHGLEYFVFTELPLAERRELLRASEAFLADVRNDNLPHPHEWIYERNKPNYMRLLTELTDLMRADLA